VKKEPRLSARALAEVEVGRGEEDLRCKRDFRDYQKMKRLGWRNIVFFGCKNQIIIAVTKRFESGPIKSRVGAFPDVFGMTNGRFKGMESRSEPRDERQI